MLAIRDLCVRYGRHQVLSGLSLDVNPHQPVAVEGRNGSGKSSLARSILGLQPVADGHVLLNGIQTTNWSPRRIALAGVSCVGQEHECFPQLTVDEHLDAALLPFGLAKREVRLRKQEIFAQLPVLSDIRQRLAAGLSGGQLRVLSLAMAMIRRPHVLILDEPTASLAPAVITMLETQLHELISRGVILLIMEHNPSLIASLGCRRMRLENGRLSSIAAIEQTNDEPRPALIQQ